MVCISAAADALEAFHLAVLSINPSPVPDATSAAWSAKRMGRVDRLIETLKLAFDLRSRPQAWRKEALWLFRIRGSAVHFTESFKGTQPHPLGTNTAPENVVYSVESCDRAVDLMLEGLSECDKRPKGGLPAVVKWAEDMRPSVVALLKRR